MCLSENGYIPKMAMFIGSMVIRIVLKQTQIGKDELIPKYEG